MLPHEAIPPPVGGQPAPPRGGAFARSLLLFLLLPLAVGGCATGASPSSPAVAPGPPAPASTPTGITPVSAIPAVPSYYPPRAPTSDGDGQEAPPAPGARRGPVSRPGQGILIEQLTFQHVPLQDAIAMLSEKAGVNIVYDPALLRGKFVTAELKNVYLDDALAALLRVHGLAALNLTRGDIEVRSLPD